MSCNLAQVNQVHPSTSAAESLFALEVVQSLADVAEKVTGFFADV